MTDTEVDVETQAQQLVARGREVLVERMRTAYGDAAAAQADLITLDDTRIETMVQAAADRADGLQWRRALAAVAADEFGISPTEALSHPAVTRAQSLVGAPSYEQSLAELIARPVPPAAPACTPPPAETTVADDTSLDQPAGNGAISEAEQFAEPAPYAEDPSDELETVEADDVVLELLPEPDPAEYTDDNEPEAVAYPSDNEPEAVAYPPEPEAAWSAPEPQPVEYETQAYDVEASFTEAAMPPAPANPFAEMAPAPIPEPYAVPEPEHVAGDEYLPPTEQHHSAGVAAALAAVAVPGSVPDPIEPDPHAAEEQQPEPEPEPEPESESELESEPAVEDENIEVSFAAVHLGGVAGLPTKREGLSVRLSSDGLDIMQGPREIIGRLVWDEIEALEVPNVRVRRRQKGVRARLVVRTPHGDASFEVPDVETDELRDRVEPLMRLYGRH